MSSSLVFPVVWLLAMLAAAAHAARPGLKLADIAWLLAAFALTLGLTLWIPAQPGWVAILAALTAGWRLARPGTMPISMALAGLCAGLAGGLYAAAMAGPLPGVWGGVAAVAVCGAPLAVVVVMARDAAFAPPGVRDVVLLAVAWLAVVAAAAPEVIAGWRAAQALNQAAESAALGVPVWTVVVVVLVMIAGAAHAWMVRR